MSRHQTRNGMESSFDGNEENENMVSNLPLLFANGYPTSLEKITEIQLQTFIPFMVKCSLGKINTPLSDLRTCVEPEWWPEDVAFNVPLKKPPGFRGSWSLKMKEIVATCYTFHRCVFLLRFCENLASYPPEHLRFINNQNSTTSLYDRRNNKLLVTFRNENMMYDLVTQTNNKKTLLPRTQSALTAEQEQDTEMVEQALFDIYLCDNCEAELYSLDAFKEHEKTCQNYESEDDDVIFCGEEPALQQTDFLHNFQLTKRDSDTDSTNLKTVSGLLNNNHIDPNKVHPRELSMKTPDKKMKRMSRRAHATMTIARCPTIPISSPAGQRLLKSAITEDYLRERIERVERFCPAPNLGYDAVNRPKFLDKRIVTNAICTYRKSSEPYRCFTFPRRQFSIWRRNESIKILQSIWLKQNDCKSIQISLERLTNDDIERIKSETKAEQSSYRSPVTKLARRTHVVDVIDLCDSDEENDGGSSMANNSKENIQLNSPPNNVQLTQGNKRIDLKKFKQSLLTDLVKAECDSTSDRRKRDLENIFNNRKSITVSLKRLSSQGSSKCTYDEQSHNNQNNREDISIIQRGTEDPIKINNFISIDLTT